MFNKKTKARLEILVEAVVKLIKTSEKQSELFILQDNTNDLVVNDIRGIKKVIIALNKKVEELTPKKKKK